MEELSQASIRIFDIDYSLKEDPSTKDFRELINEDSVNQSIDLFVSNPYRIGVGFTNGIFSSLFSDINNPSEVGDLQSSLLADIERGMPELTVTYLKVDPKPEKRAIYIRMEWDFNNYNVSGSYTRYWNLKD